MSVEDLPFVSVQPDWDEVVREVASNTVPEGSFWIACYREGYTSVQGSVEVRRKGPNDVTLEGKEGIQVEKLNSRSFKANCEALGLSNITIYSPKTTLNPVDNKPLY
ncbi:hypothetical protein BD560DRAFT_228547 [Blakeslea trispora]|nr:hypothetical protein BD560DRAFT_228547 [Blakeslea trispora]